MESSSQPPTPPTPPVPSGWPPAGDGYPLTFSVDYPDRDLNRVSTAFRVFAVIPIAILIGTIDGGGAPSTRAAAPRATRAAASGCCSPVLLMILFRRKYPRWWYDWDLELTRFSNRIGVYVALMDDRYPSTDEEQAVHLDFPHPDVERDLSRGLPIVKWFLAIPHYIVLFLLTIEAVLAVERRLDRSPCRAPC